MKHTPRYDPQVTDPLSLKPALSQMFNNLLTELWMSSPLKDRMVIGGHNIECSGAIRESRYRESRTGRFDGIHPYGSSGRKAYTRSVLNILEAANITSPDYHGPCAQFIHQNRQIRANRGQRGNSFGAKNIRDKYVHTQKVFNIPTHNRYEALYTQGNW